jgi:predicted aspartyl protease
MRPACAAILAVLLAFLTACSTAPKPTVKQAYLTQRLAWVDTSRPCYMDPFAASPIRVIHHRIVLPVMVNGVQTIGILDTGAAATLITPELAQAAKVEILPRVERFRGVAGSFTTQLAIAKKLQVGTSVSLIPRVLHVFAFGGSNGAVVGAQIGLDVLAGLDYDLDLPHETMRPYRTSNCAAIDPPWRDTYTGVVLTRGFNGRGDGGVIFTSAGLLSVGEINIPVTFPHSEVNAAFDTGSTDSLLSHDAAIEAGATRMELARDKTVEGLAIDGRKRKVIVHQFPDLAIGEQELRNMPIGVAPTFDRRDPDMILGMDYIEKHHFWLSFTTNALYIDSGEPRKPTPPLDRAHWIAGSELPAYPQDANGEQGDVKASCTIEPDGQLSNCRLINDSGHAVLGKAALRWLTGDYGPVMQPAYRDGKPVRDTHTWTINFVPGPR